MYSMMFRSRSLAVLIALLLMLAVPVTASAAPIPLDKARAVAYKAGVAAAKQTHGYGPKVLSCKRTTSRKALCKVQLHYRIGAKTCVLEVRVFYRSRTSTRLTYSYGQTVCS